MLGHRLKGGVELVKGYGDLPTLPCRLGQLNQVFLNVLTNAIEAMDGQGRLTLTTLAEDGFAVVRIEDEGPGIPPDVLPHLFDPFFTTKEVGHGMGLGLSISYRIVEGHGGSLEAHNRPEGRAAFTVRLPLTPGAVP